MLLNVSMILTHKAKEFLPMLQVSTKSDLKCNESLDNSVQTFLQTATFIGLWMNGTVCLLRSVRHVVLTSLKLVLLKL